MVEFTAQRPARIIGRYALFADIASGGMATVHIGRLLGPVGFSRTVAIKRLHAQFARDPEFVTMFLDEARLAARIRHPNVIPTLDVVATQGELFLVMEYVQGESLAQLSRTVRGAGGSIPLSIVRGVMSGILHGLHAAHEAKSERGEPLGIVHRDVSPQNILVGTDGIARVLDFGIAKAAGRAHVTRDQHVKGKLAYMAPEQFQSQIAVDRRVDVYAAAIVLWEVLTGKRLFLSDSETTTLARVLTGEVPPPSSLAPEVPSDLDRIVLRGVHRDPAMRFSSAREMALALEASGSLATPSVVGEWVEATAQTALSVRAKHIAEVELVKDLPQIAVSSRPPPITLGGTPNDNPTVVTPLSRPDIMSSSYLDGVSAFGSNTENSRSEASLKEFIPRMQPRRMIAGIALGVALAVTFIWIGFTRHSTAAAVGGAAVNLSKLSGSSTPIAPKPYPEEPPSEAMNLKATAEPLAAAATEGSKPDSANPSASATSSLPRAKSAKLSGPSARPAPHSKPQPADCNPPYTLDDVGHRHYKLECL